MSVKIGVDFGTTNSTVAFVNRSGILEAFRYLGPGGYEYIPSCVAYEKDGTISIGRGALEIAADPEVTFCSNFKMILPLSDTDRAQYNWTNIKSPETVVTDFLSHLLRVKDGSSFESNKSKIEGIVLSVPHVWAKEMHHAGRSRMQTILAGTGLPLIQLISEPVAAAAYYAHQFKQKEGKPFMGNLLVCDVGGGTFDVTLCQLTPGKVEELYNDGNGSTGLGKAGVYFDRKLLLDKDATIKADSPEFYKLYNALQNYKINWHKDITKRIENAIRERDYWGRQILRCEGHIFDYNDISSAFAEVKESIDAVLKRFKSAIEDRKYAVDAVFFVGGFAQFLPVREAIKKFWGLEQNDPRFVEDMSNEIAGYAIAYGAALVANDTIIVEEKYEHTIGVEVFLKESRGDSPVYEHKTMLIPIIHGGKKLSEYEAVQFAPNLFKTSRAQPDVTIYVDESSRNCPVLKKLGETPAITLPQKNRPNEDKWYIGMRINKSKVVYLVFKRKYYDETIEYELGDLLRQMFGGLEIVGEGQEA